MKQLLRNPAFTLFAVLNVLLLSWKGKFVLHHWSSLAGAIAMIIVSSWLAATTASEKKATLHKTAFFKRSFKVITSMEILLTILLPWLLLLWVEVLPVDDTRREILKWISHIVPHLFVFQTQIMMEGPLSYRKHVEMFIFTVVANAVRGWVLLQWWQQKPSDVLDRFLLSATVILWCVSSFVFLPFIWYPCLQWEKMHTK